MQNHHGSIGKFILNRCYFMLYLMMLQLSMTSASLMTRGGASLMMSPWVGFASSPRSLSLRHTYAIAVVRSEVSTL